MTRRVTAPAPATGGAGVAKGDPCPRCGGGDLVTIDVARRGGGRGRGLYCAGLYDRDRRRFLRPSCGFTDYLCAEAGAAPAEGLRAAANSSPGFQRGMAAVSATLYPT